MQYITGIFLSVFLLTSSAIACPSIGGIADYNCDGEIRMVFMGDSLVFGFGDTKNDNQGGYVLRVANKLPDVKISNQGVQGLKTFGLISMIRKALVKRKDEKLLEDLLTADYVIFDVGRNDRWNFGEPISTLRNLNKAARLIKTRVERTTLSAPLVIKAVMMLPNRGSQGPWMKELNQLILKSNREDQPANLRFDLVSKRLLSSDQIHPTPKGYAALAKAFLTYLEKDLPDIVSKNRPDSDSDGVYDLFETVKFGTNPAIADSDADGKNDGQELFSTKTNPLAVD